MECFAGDRCCASVIVLVTLSKDHTTLIEQFLIYATTTADKCSKYR